MSRIMCLFNKVLITILLSSFILFTGCKGSDTREKVDSTVEEFAGKKKVDQMKDMKQSIGKIQDQQSDRLNQLDNMDDKD